MQVLFILPSSANVDLGSHNNWYQSISISQQLISELKLTKGNMSKIGSSTIKFEVKKFIGKENFSLWQKRVKALLV